MQEKEALARLMQLCSRQEKCRYDLRQKLQQWGIENDAADAILSKLEMDNFLNEERYASAYARDKVRFNKWGRLKIRYQLRTKGISSVNIDKALTQFDEKEYRNLIQNELLSKAKKVKAQNDWERRGKLMKFAQSRGYEPDMVMETIDSLKF